MTTNYISAIDQMFNLVNQAFIADASSTVGYVPEIRWQGVPEQNAPDASKYWLRVSQQTTSEGQITLRDENGVRRYQTIGVLFVQVFCPKSEVDAMAKGRLLAVIARNSFRGKTTSGKVIFSNVRIKELPPEESAYRLNVVADYEYDEIN